MAGGAAFLQLRGKIIKMEVQVGTLWTIYVEDSLRGSLGRGAIERRSPYYLSDATLRAMVDKTTPAMMQRSWRVVAAAKRKLNDADLRSWIVDELTIDVMRQAATALDMGIGEYLAHWIIAVRQAEREGYQVFMGRLEMMFDDAHTAKGQTNAEI